MAVFVYKAINAEGRQIKGVIDAESIRLARQRLKQQGIFPTQVQEGQAPTAKTISLRGLMGGKGVKISTAQLAVVTRQFATLVAAGMPLVEGLRALADQIDQPAHKGVIAEVGDKVNEGSTLANAMRDYPSFFPRLYVNMVASGEASGTLDMVLERLADLLEAQAALRRKIVSALTYPVLMLCLCFGVIMLLLAYVVPQITAIFQDRKVTLPLPTRIVIGLSDFVQSHWFLIILALCLAIAGFRWYARTAAGHRKIDSILLKLPLIGPLQLRLATSRLARNLGMMLASGIEMLTALSIAKNITGNVLLEEAIERAIEGVREGSPLAVELNKSGLFPRLLIHMVAIGEKTGSLEQMLLRAAEAYESEVDAVVAGFTSILEPVLIIFLALVVGGILASVMLPMLEMTSLTKS